ncbi:MAG: hypothetical protein ACOYKA_02790 [Legionellaceae bacterium]
MLLQCYRSMRPTGPSDSREEIDGAALETLCLEEFVEQGVALRRF